MNEAGRRLQHKNFDGAQQGLEKFEHWTPSTRSLAVETHRLLQQELGRQPLGINDALDVLTTRADDWVRHERTLGQSEHLQEAQSTLELITRAREGTDSASLQPILVYIEGVLGSEARSLTTQGGDLAKLNETRDVRNALVENIEQLQQREARTERAGRTLAQQQAQTSDQLRSLWRQAAMTANGEVLGRISQLSPAELRGLTGELSRLRQEARDGKLDRGQLVQQLETAVNQHYDTESVRARNQAAADETAARAREVIRMSAPATAEIPATKEQGEKPLSLHVAKQQLVDWMYRRRSELTDPTKGGVPANELGRNPTVDHMNELFPKIKRLHNLLPLGGPDSADYDSRLMQQSEADYADINAYVNDQLSTVQDPELRKILTSYIDGLQNEHQAWLSEARNP